jgi:hypothetical protein
MPAITISREIGSKGDTIAEQVARRVGYQLVDKNLIEKIFLQFGFIDFRQSYDQTGFWSRFDPHHTEMVTCSTTFSKPWSTTGMWCWLAEAGLPCSKGTGMCSMCASRPRLSCESSG